MPEVATNIEAPYALAVPFVLLLTPLVAIYGDFAYAFAGTYHFTVNRTYMGELRMQDLQRARADGDVSLESYMIVEKRTSGAWGSVGRISATPEGIFKDPISSFSAFGFWSAGLCIIFMPWEGAAKPPHLYLISFLMMILAAVTTAFHRDASMGAWAHNADIYGMLMLFVATAFGCIGGLVTAVRVYRKASGKTPVMTRTQSFKATVAKLAILPTNVIFLVNFIVLPFIMVFHEDLQLKMILGGSVFIGLTCNFIGTYLLILVKFPGYRKTAFFEAALGAAAAGLPLLGGLVVFSGASEKKIALASDSLHEMSFDERVEIRRVYDAEHAMWHLIAAFGTTYMALSAAELYSADFSETQLGTYKCCGREGEPVPKPRLLKYDLIAVALFDISMQAFIFLSSGEAGFTAWLVGWNLLGLVVTPLSLINLHFCYREHCRICKADNMVADKSRDVGVRV